MTFLSDRISICCCKDAVFPSDLGLLLATTRKTFSGTSPGFGLFELHAQALLSQHLLI